MARGEAARRGSSSKLTERDQFWLRHDAACRASGEPAKAYAKRQGLSVHALYQARKRLRSMGALPGPSATAQPTTRPRFARVILRTKPDARSDFRVRLPNGVSVEWAGVAVPESLGALLALAGRLS